MKDGLRQIVISHLHFDGPDNSTNFIDTAGRQWLSSGAARIRNGEYVFGGASAYFDGAGSFITIFPESDLILGLRRATYEFFFRPIALNQYFHIMLDTRSSSGPGNDGLIMWVTHSGQLRAWVPGTYVAPDGTEDVYTSPGSVQTGVWYHAALEINDSVVSLFLDGVCSIPTARRNRSIFPLNSNQMRLGQTREGGNYYAGYIDEFRYTRGAVRYGSDFVPASQPYPEEFGVDNAEELVSKKFRGTPSNELTAGVVLKPATVRDMEFSGRGRIAGTVKVKGTPNVPTKRRVRLLRDRDFLLVRETWSDPVTGAYAFHEIDERYTYTVIADDYEGNFRAVLADRVVPEVMQ